MQPWGVTHKTLQKTAGEDVVRLAAEGALFEVGDLALQFVIIIFIERERPDAFSAIATR